MAWLGQTRRAIQEKPSPFSGTYKLKKTDLQKAGFDPRQLNGDRLYYLNSQTGRYEPLSPNVYNSILKGAVSF